LIISISSVIDPQERIKDTRIKNDLQELVGTRNQQLLEQQTKEGSLIQPFGQNQNNDSSADNELLQLSKEKIISHLTLKNL